MNHEDAPATCLHELFELQVDATPDAVAVVAPDGAALTYDELDRRANRLAWSILGRAPGPEARVGVCLPRSPDLVVALLGVLKAGAVYVPLDPGYPRDRLQYMREDARVALVLVGHLDGTEAERETRPAAPTAPDGLAYVVYTSGSTGRPKGVMVSHRAVCNHTLWFQDAFRLHPRDRLLHKTPIGFDPSITEFFAPLVAGGRLVLGKGDIHQDPRALVDAVVEHGITVLQVVPTLLRLLVDQPRLSECASLRMVVSGGEALPEELVARLRERLPVPVHNLYGPTEAAIDTLCHPDAGPGGRTLVPIGRPIANTRAHLLDRELRPVPAGDPGELYLGGPSLARGYLDRPGATAERFVPDPFAGGGSGPGARLYRTGDLARRLPDGSMEFLGRGDHQIKIRGVRVEPGEVEAALLELPAVREAVVVLSETAAGRSRLVAYVGVGPDRAAAARRDLAAKAREHLVARLPAQMVPSATVVLDALPRMPSGKLDRSALPPPPAPGARRSTAYVAPRTPTERELADAFERMLDVDRLGVDDPLFELGADSLAIAQLGTYVAEAYGVALPLFLLFASPTVAGVAATVEAYARDGGGGLVAANTALVRDDGDSLDPDLVPEWAR